jgi:molybdopterin synthase catalytic subunit
MRAAMVRTRINPSALLEEVASTASGATILFVGTVRETSEGRAVSGIEYTAYEPMAKREMDAILQEAATRFHTNDIVVEHRIGELALGEASVAIVVAHAHRSEAYDASRYVIEQLKRRVPIWKREAYVDGTREWVDPTATRAEIAR